MPKTSELTPAASMLSTERVVATTAAGATVSVLASGMPVSTAQTAQFAPKVDPEFTGTVTLPADTSIGGITPSPYGMSVIENVNAEQVRASISAAPAALSGAAQRAPLVEAGAGLAMKTGEVIVYDDFQRADGVLNGSTSTSGHVWDVSGPGQLTAEISDGKYIAGGTGDLDNTYAYLDYGSAIPRISGTFSFVRGAGANERNSTSLTLIADKAGTVGGLSDMLHFRLSPDFWSIEKRVGGEEPFPVLATGYHYLTEGVVYSAAIEIDGSTIRIFPPQGAPVTVTDSEIGDIAPLRYGNWQIRNLTDSWQGRWHSVQMGPSNFDKRSDLVPTPDVGFLRGSGINARQRFACTLSGGVGWYRIATQSGLLGSANITGQIWLNASYASGADAVVLGISSSNSGILTFNQRLYAARGNPALYEVRLSRLSTGTVALDVYLNVAGTTEITGDCFGFFTPTTIASPTVGAVALATESVIVRLSALAQGVGAHLNYGTITGDGTRGGVNTATGVVARGGNNGSGSYIEQWLNFSGAIRGGIKGDGSIDIWDGAAIRTIVFGAADSGGTGFRMVRVAN